MTDQSLERLALRTLIWVPAFAGMSGDIMEGNAFTRPPHTLV